jgi:isoleucyl-tRNA synthetase
LTGAELVVWTSGRHPGEEVRFAHPLYDRESLAVLGDYVTVEDGTGVVHTAPGHGADDFHTGVRYNLDTYAPVDSGGHFLDDVPRFGGLRVFDANPRIEEALAARGRLWHRGTIEHSYPHCWRCHNPVIFLATRQWFIDMEHGALRARALEAIARVTWVPSWGRERIHGMLANRPDWCISRQRSWGVPIPAVYCESCREPLLTCDLVERAAAIFEAAGADAWYERPVTEFLPPNLACPGCGGTSFEREHDILDVWFDSGSSHEGVLGRRPELGWPADLYVEGSDQHRGWFHSSLLVGLGTRGAAPFRTVLTHGFVVDEEGRRMSKSRGTGVEPQDIIRQSGAEILRLWAATVDYRDEVRLGPEILARVVEAYRKIRNTLRFLAANLYDYDPSRDAVPYPSLLEIDRYALARYGATAGTVLAAYDAYDFPAVFPEVNRLLTVELSAFYLDVSKDRLYTVGTTSHARRSAQTAIWIMVDGLARLLAPILPVTMDELWGHLPGQREASVHLADFPGDLASLADAALVERWTRLLRLRDVVNVQIERLRADKVVGTSLEAAVTLTVRGQVADLVERYRDDLAMLFITSEVGVASDPTLTPAQAGADGSGLYLEPGGMARVEVARASGVRCTRCWRYVGSVASEPAVEGLCERCVDAVAGVARRAGS